MKLPRSQRSWPNPVRPRLIRDLHRRVTTFLMEEGVLTFRPRRKRPVSERDIMADKLLRTISPGVLESAGYKPPLVRPHTRWDNFRRFWTGEAA